MSSTIRHIVCLMILSLGSSAALLADNLPPEIEGWGKFVDPAVDTKIELNKDGVLEMIAPDVYVDNFGKTAAPRVMQDVAGDFTAEVKVLEVEPSKPKTVLAALGSFPTAYHSATVLIRHDDKNFVRLEYSSACNQEVVTACNLHVYQDGKRVYLKGIQIKDMPTRLKLERKGNEVHAAISQDDGKKWQEFEKAKIEFLPKNVEVGISMTSNTMPGCTVKFRDLKITRK